MIRSRSALGSLVVAFAMVVSVPAASATLDARPAANVAADDGKAKGKPKAKAKKNTATITLDGTVYGAVPADQCIAGGLGFPPEFRSFRGVVGDLLVWIEVGGRGGELITAKSVDDSYTVWFEASSSSASEGASVGDPKITKDGASGTATLANVNDGGTVPMAYTFRC